MNIFSKLFSLLQPTKEENDRITKTGIFRSTRKERDSFFVSFADVVFLKDHIEISKYPFKPSTIYPSNQVFADRISDISINSCPPTIRLNKELIFISATLKDNLKSFAVNNNIKIVERTFNWDFILDPFLDTEFTKEDEVRTSNYLVKNGITMEEVNKIRADVKAQMMKYNFDTLLWEWQSLGLYDVLQAMRPKLAEDSFAIFYWKAMDIALRCNNQ